MKNNIYFVTGIDTDAGKSYATGYIALQWNLKGINTITQKLVQTGNHDFSEDIDLHRKIMGIQHTEEDKKKLTMPEIFTYPASPHLASEIDKRKIDFKKIEEYSMLLSERYDALLIEGAGGLMVPLKRDYLTIDYITDKNYPVILVTSGKLGSLNHTLLSLEAIKTRNISLHTLAYNLFPDVNDKTIQNDTQNYIREYLEKEFPETRLIEIPMIKL